MTRIRPSLIDLACCGVLLGLAGAGCAADEEPGPAAPSAQSSTDAAASATGSGAAANTGVTPGRSTPATPTDAGSAPDGSPSAPGQPSVDAGGAGADDAGTADVPEMYSAVAAIRAAFRDNAYGDYPTLVKGIDTAAKGYPEDATIARYAAILRLWRLTEAGRDPALDLLELAPVLLEARSRFETARQLAPNDGRLVGWSAAITLRAGQLLGSATQIATGKQELEASIPTYPGFNLFVQGSTYAALPRTDADFAQAADKIYESFKTCGYDLDRDNPVLPAAPNAAVTSSVCSASSYAPHPLEGMSLNLGDALVKAGKPQVAKAAYKNAMTSAAYASWPYRALLEQRIANAEANAASFDDADAANDFKVPIEEGNFCVGCHATKL